MIVYRITHKKWANSLVASGYPARWNKEGQYIIYTSESMALCCLENLVHRKGKGLNALFSVMHISIPDTLPITEINQEQLPQGWDGLTENAFEICRIQTQKWITSGQSALLKVPSVIIPNESNILINTQHPDFNTITLKGSQPFDFDARLKEL